MTVQFIGKGKDGGGAGLAERARIVNTLGLRHQRQLNEDVIQATKYVALDLKKEARDGYINLGVIREQFLKTLKYRKSPRKTIERKKGPA